jgi:hypothetical protein
MKSLFQMTRSNLWTSNATHRIFGWNDILEEWNDTLETPTQVTVAFDNLKAASDQEGFHEPPLSQFLGYLNYEQAGIMWLLYECITIRWMFGSIRVDYIRNLIDEIENLDGYFPAFPGSPQTLTIREFVENNLDADELDAVEMLPPLVAFTPAPAPTPVRATRADYSYAQKAPFHSRVNSSFSPVSPPALQRTSRFTPTEPTRSLSAQFDALKNEVNVVVKPIIHFRFFRNDDKKTDDYVNITQKSGDLYNITHVDQDSNVKTRTMDVDRNGVLNFISITLRFMTIDEEPFKSIQLTLPSIPTILISPHNLTSQTRELIYDSLDMTMDNWPTCA